MRQRTPRLASGALAFTLAVALTGCGTQDHAVEVPVTRPTLFPPDYTAPPPTAAPDSSSPTSSTTTTKAPRPVPTVVDDGKARAVVTRTGIVAAVREGRADGTFLVTSPCGNPVVVSGATPIVRVNVVLDPGHGGAPDPGAVGASGLTEADLNLAVAQLVKAKLEAAGVTVALTRTGNTYSTLASRAAIATSLAPDAFVSIHHNATPNHTEDTPGTEVYYQADDEVRSKRLSGLIHQEVVAALSTQQIRWGWYDDAGVKVRLNDRGGDYYGILRNAAGVPTALAELSYLSTAPEEALLRTDAFRDLEATAVARAIVRYLTTDDPGTGFVGPSKRTEAATGGGAAACVDPAL